MNRFSISSAYIQAANALRGKQKRKRIVAYVESYDDVLFWRTVLGDFEDDTRYVEVMLPTRRTLTKGKKQVMMQMLREGAGDCLIACVDADYDYLMQGATYSSKAMLSSKYVFHTYAYAIENLQCYAPSLHNVCVMATLNDHSIFDFKAFLKRYSEIVFPLFVWNIWYYRHGDYHTFSMSDFNRVVELGHFSVFRPEECIVRLQNKVETKLRELRHRNQGEAVRREIDALSNELVALGVTPDTTYLFIQGHHLFDNVVSCILDKVCKTLRNERENEIRQKAVHQQQRQNELSSYTHSQADVTQMLKKNTGYMRSKPYLRLIEDLENFFNDEASITTPESAPAANAEPTSTR